MAQSEVTVTPPSPTPPTNLSFVGATPPHDPAQAFADDGYVSPGANVTAFADNTAAAGSGTSVDHEGRGTEDVETATSANPSPWGQTLSVSCLGNYTATPNGSHASAAAPAVLPTITALDPAAPTPVGGTAVLTVTGTGFRPDSVVHLAGVPYTTTYVSATTLKVMNAPRRTSAGTTAVTVVTGGTATAATNWTFA